MTIDMKHSILRYIAPVAGAAGLLFAGCTEEVDNAYTRFQYSMEMQASAEEIVLDEDTPDDVALTISWTPATDYGSDVTTTYKYEWYLQGSGLSAGSEYEDSGNFERSYTHEELYDIMVNRFGCLTSSWGTMQFTVTASFEGVDGQVLLDDQARVTVHIKTYGPKQFAADRVFIGGPAVGEENVELTVSENNASLYVYNGNLAAGKFNFPVIYGDENNVIIPAGAADVNVGAEPMEATVAGNDETLYSWVITEADSYRVSLNMSAKTVSVIKTADIMEVDKLFMSGSAVGAEDIEVTRTLENDVLYAWKGELSAGELYFPIEYEGERNLTMVPVNADSHDLTVDGTMNAFTTVSAVAATGRYWTVPADGTYRIIVNTDERSVAVYSAENDMKNKKVLYKKTHPENEANDNYEQEITILYMWSGNTYNTGSRPVGGEFVLTQSLANPRLFVYKGAALKSGENLKFLVSDSRNNVYAFGAGDTGASGNDVMVNVEKGQKFTPIYGGQGNNRYTYFVIPEDTNYIELYVGSESTDEPVGENALNHAYAFADSYVLFDQR